MAELFEAHRCNKTPMVGLGHCQKKGVLQCPQLQSDLKKSAFMNVFFLCSRMELGPLGPLVPVIEWPSSGLYLLKPSQRQPQVLEGISASFGPTRQLFCGHRKG